jgi:cytochrome c-type biogenesis protein CcmH
MVDRLAKRLETSPDDPEGWARLVRAEGVLKDKAAQDAALAKARKLFAGRPDALSRIEAQAKAVPAP